MTQLELDLLNLATQPEWKQMIVDIVKNEKMDPWDIDITTLSSRFMEQVRKMKEFDFRVPANAILASSILLRYKSDSWVINQEEEETPLIYIPNEIYSEPTIPTLEPVMRVTKRKVSLEELLFAVEDLMLKTKIKASKKRVKQNFIPTQLTEMLMNQENFDTLIKRVYERIKKKVDKENLVMFSSLIEERTPDEVISCFIPLLHLANSQKVSMWQEKTFGDIFINLLPNGNGKPTS